MHNITIYDEKRDMLIKVESLNPILVTKLDNYHAITGNGYIYLDTEKNYYKVNLYPDGIIYVLSKNRIYIENGFVVSEWIQNLSNGFNICFLGIFAFLLVSWII